MTQSVPAGRGAVAGRPVRTGHARPPAGRHYLPPLIGLATVLIIGLIFAVAVGLFQGSFTETVPVTVISQRAGLVMNPDAKVKMRGVQVGKVSSIEPLPNGEAAIHLAMDPSQLRFIPSNVLVDIASSTVFGAKSVQLVEPAQPAAQRLHGGQTLQGQHVMVEINTVFQQLVSVLSHIDPPKLNESLGALAQAFSGRGPQLGQSLSDLDSFLAKLEPSLPAFRHDFSVLPAVANAYADAAPDLVKTAANATRISKTIVDEQHNLDALLISTIGLADIGNDVLSTNRQPLTDVMHLLVPTTDLTNEYNPALTCAFGGLVRLSHAAPLSEPSINISASLVWGAERYRYPTNLPKVAATGGPRCVGLPSLPFNTSPPQLIADIGADPVVYGNPQLMINSDLLKQLLYGPIAGPPRNSAQIGQPG
ncbi:MULTISPECIES: MCE family protein [unclassified Mycobacterium]|uniref:MCE family protein n=1 Tax=unclassified Mycobacterium TaxID=2642494 RepID=UPI0007FCAF69|nr:MULTISPECIES: MCE family protein [unclassified Mycobacterium]OBG58402.1 MCE-family protein [Mycobacterium sp. E735]OBG63190.1 MCE-family protein [Mycobacterium sp. E188]OBG76893.1 MCE-family protein [Mycobacterium sp. E3305]OBG81416.1 MCE-family protein [Mycobacterium sp. E3298]OBH24071.1 MCE-family protein [Mycobacterium sp. E1715]